MSSPLRSGDEFGQPLERGLEAEVVEGGRPQLDCQPSNVVEGGADELADQRDGLRADLRARSASVRAGSRRVPGRSRRAARGRVASARAPALRAARARPLGRPARRARPRPPRGSRTPARSACRRRRSANPALLVIGDDDADRALVDEERDVKRRRSRRRAAARSGRSRDRRSASRSAPGAAVRASGPPSSAPARA